MKQVVGYLVKKGDTVIGATGDKAEAMFIAENWSGICYEVVTTIDSKADPVSVFTAL